MNSTGTLSQRGSSQANEYAQKKREQLENSKRLREQRASGNSVLQNVGEHFVHRKSSRGSLNNNNGGTMSPSIHQSYDQMSNGGNNNHITSQGQPKNIPRYPQYGRIINDSSQQNNQNNGQRFNQQLMPSTDTSGYGGLQNRTIEDSFEQIEAEVNNQFMSPINNQHSDAVKVNVPMRTSNNYYDRNRQNHKKPSQNDLDRLNTINYAREIPNANYTSISGFNQNNNSISQTRSSHQNGLQTQQFAAPSSANVSNYSRKDVEQARGSLQLLKKRKSSSSRQQRMSVDRSSQHKPMNSTLPETNGKSFQSSRQAQNSSVNLSSNLRNIPRPRPNNESGTLASAGEQTNQDGIQRQNSQSYQNSNYRKVFKPGQTSNQNQSNPLDQLNDDHNGNSSSFNSKNNYDQMQHVNDVVLGNTSSQMKSQRTPNQNRQMQQQSYSYQPQRHEQPSRQIDQSPQMMDPYQSQAKDQYNQQYSSYNNESIYNNQQATSSGNMSKSPAPRPKMTNTQKKPPMASTTNRTSVRQPEFNEDVPVQNIASNLPNEAFQQQEDDGDRVQCEFCGRKFAADRIDKHRNVCNKGNAKQRKVFNSAAARQVEGQKDVKKSSGKSDFDTMQPQYNRGKPPVGKNQRQREQPIETKQGKIPKWKLQSMQFRQAVAPVAKPDSYGSANGASNFNPSMQASVDTDDRVPCQFCGRKFAETTAERHIPVCEKKYKENLIKMGGRSANPRGGRTATNFRR